MLEKPTCHWYQCIILLLTVIWTVASVSHIIFVLSLRPIGCQTGTQLLSFVERRKRKHHAADFVVQTYYSAKRSFFGVLGPLPHVHSFWEV
jgi:hypothetical protein